MKLFIYYSLSGNGDYVADYLKTRGFEIRKVIPKRGFKKASFFNIFRGGFLAGIRYKNKLKDFDENIEGYDEIVIGSPIWNARFSTPINTVLSKLDLKDKKVTFLFYAGSGEGPKVLKLVNKLYPEARVIFLKEPKSHPDEIRKLDY